MTSRRARILVVDDAKEVLRMLVTTLSSIGGHEVFTATDVETAFEIVQRERPDLVLTDVMLNGPVGLDLITRIRSDLAIDVPAVIASSGFPDYGDEAMRRGACCFLPKPVMLDDLLAAVDHALANRPLPSDVSEEVARHSNELRRRVVARALEILDELAGERPDMARRMRWGCAFAAGYFDVRWAVIALVEQGGLEVAATSDLAFAPEGSRIEEILPFPRDVLESGAVFALSDLSTWAPAGARKLARAADEPRFCAGVPFVAGATPIGALCLLDSEPRYVEPEDLAVLAEIGRCVVARVAEGGGEEEKFFTAELLLTRHAFEALLGKELHRARRRPSTIELAVITLGRSDRGAEIAEAIARDAVPHSAVGGFGPATLGAYVVEDDPFAAARATERIVERCRAISGVAYGGVISVDGNALGIVSDSGLLRSAEGIASRTRRVRDGAVERFVVRREDWSAGGEGRASPHDDFDLTAMPPS